MKYNMELNIGRSKRIEIEVDGDTRSTINLERKVSGQDI